MSFKGNVKFGKAGQYSLIFSVFLLLQGMAGLANAQTVTLDCEQGRPQEMGGRPEIKSESCFVEGKTLYVRGVIGSLTLEAVRKNPIRRIILNSPGGSTATALALAKEVSERKIQTEVPENGFCYSSCTMVFQAGVERTAHSSANFMYHCTGLGLFGAQIIQQQCGQDPKHYDQKCASNLQELVDATITSTAEYFLNYETYGAVGIYERMQSEPDLENWFESGNFCKKRLVLSAADTMTHNVVEILKE